MARAIRPAGCERSAGARTRLWLAVLLFVLPGCHTWRPAPVDLSEPGWSIVRGQAVWRLPRRDLELAGDLLLATAPDGRGYLHFTKGPILMVEARTEPGHWLARFAEPGRTYSGPGEPPARLGWNQLLGVALGQPPTGGWIWSGSLSHRWRLEHPASGEWLEGTRLP